MRSSKCRPRQPISSAQDSASNKSNEGPSQCTFLLQLSSPRRQAPLCMLQLSCPRRQVQLCNPFLSFLSSPGMYAGQVWGTKYIKAGKELASDLQVRHMSYLKSTLGIKLTTTNWAVLRECGHEPLQFYWF
eukprot:1151823-Pelagomonas_calceolata.AAC.4